MQTGVYTREERFDLNFKTLVQYFKQGVDPVAKAHPKAITWEQAESVLRESFEVSPYRTIITSIEKGLNTDLAEVCELRDPTNIQELSKVFNVLLKEAQENPSVDMKDVVDLVWSTFLFIEYVHHWSKDPNYRNIPENLASLDVSQIKPLINQIDNSYFLKNGNPPKHTCQKLLQINKILSSFSRRAYPDNPEEMIQFPFNLNSLILAKARAKAGISRGGTGSHTEDLVNSAISAALEHSANQYAPKKQTARDEYIDQETGLELDFPFERKVTIETDGGHHMASLAHTAVHHMKARVLRESGWIRLPISVPTWRTALERDNIKRQVQELAGRYTKAIGFAPVFEYIERYQELSPIIDTITQRIMQIQKEYRDTLIFPRKNGHPN